MTCDSAFLSKSNPKIHDFCKNCKFKIHDFWKNSTSKIHDFCKNCKAKIHDYTSKIHDFCKNCKAKIHDYTSKIHDFCKNCKAKIHDPTNSSSISTDAMTICSLKQEKVHFHLPLFFIVPSSYIYLEIRFPVNHLFRIEFHSYLKLRIFNIGFSTM